MQPPPPGPPPQWGPPPDDPRDQFGPGFGGQPDPGSYGQQPPAPAYGPPQWSGYGAPVPAPSSQQTFGWISLTAIGLLGLLGHQIQNLVPTLPVVLVVCLFLIIAACLAVAAGAVMLFLKRPLGQFLILGGGIVMLVLSIGVEARYGATGRVTYDLIAGLVIAAAGGLMFISAFRVLLGLPPQLTAGPSGYPGGGHWPPGPPPPPHHSPPGPPPQW
jgi:hypothetical protein